VIFVGPSDVDVVLVVDVDGGNVVGVDVLTFHGLHSGRYVDDSHVASFQTPVEYIMTQSSFKSW